MKTRLGCLLLIFCLGLAWTPTDVSAETKPALVRQTIYAPVYSHIYSGNKERPFPLAVTVSIRNTDQGKSMAVLQADYFDSDGKLIKSNLTEPKILKPLATLRFVVKESDLSGGSGANFIIVWEADKGLNQPLVEAIMIGTQGQQGISFTSRGVIIRNQDRAGGSSQ